MLTYNFFILLLYTPKSIALALQNDSNNYDKSHLKPILKAIHRPQIEKKELNSFSCPRNGVWMFISSSFFGQSRTLTTEPYKGESKRLRPDEIQKQLLQENAPLV